MKFRFFEPPPVQCIGGLDAAIHGLRAALLAQGLATDDSHAVANHPDVAHFHGLWQPAFPAHARRCRAAGSAIVVSPHGMLEPWAWRHKWWKKWVYFQLRERRFLGAADCLLATAESEAANLRARFPGTRVEALPLGMTGDARPDYRAAREKLGWAPEETVLLFLSRIHAKKGLHLLLEALTQLSRPAHLRLVVVGGGAPAYLRELEAFSEAHRASLPRIDWMGEVWGEERWKFFQGADLFCLPTHSENFGLAVLEALQVGTPVLTTVNTPWRDYADDTRILMGEATTASTLASLERFLQKPRLPEPARGALADWARERFSWNKLAPAYVRLYRELTEK